MDKPGPWSEAEQQKLRTLYSDRTLPVAEIAAKLGRTSEATGKQARALGLWRRHKNADINQRYFQDAATTRAVERSERFISCSIG